MDDRELCNLCEDPIPKKDRARPANTTEFWPKYEKYAARKRFRIEVTDVMDNDCHRFVQTYFEKDPAFRKNPHKNRVPASRLIAGPPNNRQNNNGEAENGPDVEQDDHPREERRNHANEDDHQNENPEASNGPESSGDEALEAENGEDVQQNEDALDDPNEGQDVDRDGRSGLNRAANTSGPRNAIDENVLSHSITISSNAVARLEAIVSRIETHLSISSQSDGSSTFESITNRLSSIEAVVAHANSTSSEPNPQAETTFSEDMSSEESAQQVVRRRQTVIQQSAIVKLEVNSVAYTHRWCFICHKTGPGSRCTIPWNALMDLFIKERILIHPNSRACKDHIDPETSSWKPDVYGEIRKLEIQRYQHFNSEKIVTILHQLATRAIVKSGILEFTKETPEDTYRTILGVSPPTFEKVHDIVAPYLYQTKLRSTRKVLAVFLAKMRLGVSQRVLAIMFGISSQQLVSYMIRRVTILLDKHLVPKYLGFHHMPRHIAEEHDAKGLASRLFEVDEGNISFIVDGTYFQIQKPSDHEEQCKTWCSYKHYNLLKSMVFALGDGYIIEASSVWYPDFENNDAKIIQKLLQSGTTCGLILYMRDGDNFVFDRGFRDAVKDFERHQMKVQMPLFLPNNVKTFTPEEANYNRKVTLARWVVEAINGKIKVWKYLDRKIETTYAFGQLASHVRICCALHNMDFVPFVIDESRHEHILKTVAEREEMCNLLLERVKEERWDTRRKCWKSLEEAGNIEFPKLTEDDLIAIGLGTYQLKQAENYSKRMEKLQINTEEKNLVRAIIKSRFRSGTMHQSIVQYDMERPGDKAILGYGCTCPIGGRVIGTCSHVMSVLWLLGVERHDPKKSKRRNTVTQRILDAAEYLGNVESDKDSDNDEIIEPIYLRAGQTTLNRDSDNEEIEEPIYVTPVQPTEVRFGIPNVGNTCFLNSVMQLLISIDEFCEHVWRKKMVYLTGYLRGILRNKLTREDANTCRDTLIDWIKDEVLYGDYTRGAQQDATGFLLKVLEPTVMQEFKEHVTTYVEYNSSCSRCSKTHEAVHGEIGLWVNPSSLLMRHMENLEMEDEDCSCGGTFLRTRRILSVSKYILIFYKLFHPNTEVKEFGPMLEEDFSFKLGRQIRDYKLKGVITHFGRSIHSGHYVVYLKREDHYLCLNDESVSRPSEVGGDVYICLYEECEQQEENGKP